MSSNLLSKLFSGRGKLGCFGVVGFFIISVLVTNFLADFVNTRTHPQRYAQIYGCRGDRDGSTYYANKCDEPIHLRYCFYTEAGTSKTACRTALLEPGEGVDTVVSDSLALKRQGVDIWATQIWACKVPFLPDMVPNRNKRTQMERGCRKPDDERAPAIGPDPELQAALDADEAS